MMRTLSVFAALALAACSGTEAPQIVMVTPETPKPVAPSECTRSDPPFPKLPETDIDSEGAVRDRVAIEGRDQEIARRRAVCRAWLKRQFGADPAPAQNRRS